MALRDYLSSAVGRAISYGSSILEDGIRKAQDSGGDGSDDDEDASSMAMTVAGQRSESLPPQPATDDPRALLFDPFALIDQLGYRDRPSGLTYQTLREIAKRVPTELAIIQNRLLQVSGFATPQVDMRDPGFEIKLRDRNATPDKEDRRRMVQLTDWLLNTGSTWGPGRDDFKTFLLKLTRDSLELDGAAFEVVRNRKQVPAEFYCLDGATIRLADVPPSMATAHDQDIVKFVQVYDEVIIAEFSANDLAYCVRNPRSDIRVNGYGCSETEMLLSIVTATLWAVEYNKNQFRNGTMAKGILNFKGSVPDGKLDSFRRQFRMMLSGVENAGRMPMTNVEDVQWLNLSQNNRDIEFGSWLDWLTKISCAVHGMDPAEINFTYGNTGQTSSMNTAPVEQKMTQSKDRGLRPLLDWLAGWFNTNLVWRLDPRYKFQFVGLDGRGSDAAVALQKQKATFLMTVDEIRAQDDLPPIPDGKGACILDPTWLQFSQAKDAASPGGGMPGGGDAEMPQDEGRDQQEQQPDEYADDQMGAVFGSQPQQAEKSLLRKSITRIRYEIEV